MLGRGEHPIGVLESTSLDAVFPDYESVASAHEGSRVAGVGQMKSAIAKQPNFHHLVAQPSHAAYMLNAVVL